MEEDCVNVKSLRDQFERSVLRSSNRECPSTSSLVIGVKTTNTSGHSKGKISAQRPPIAPKPKHLPEYKPMIPPHQMPIDLSNTHLFNNGREHTADSDGVKEKARRIEALLPPPTINLTIPRSFRTASSSSTMRSIDGDDDADSFALDISSSDEGQEDSERCTQGISSVNISQRSSMSSAIGNGGMELHELIMKELKRKKADRTTPEIPEEVGSIRKNKTVNNRGKRGTTEKTLSGCSDTSSDRWSDTLRPSDVPVIPDYSTGDADEDSRLKKLHWAAHEFLTVQRSFVSYLDQITQVFPEYLRVYSSKCGRSILPTTVMSPGNSMENMHVIHRINKLLAPYLLFHQNILLNDITVVMQNWSSFTPNMSSVFEKSVPFLKQCLPFLKEKGRIADEMTQLCKENPDFQIATLLFEKNVFNRGIGAVIQQLDQVHQNFMRYKILMMRYREYLPKESEEYKRSQYVIDSLETVSLEVNAAMGLPTSEELLQLSTQFQGHFNVFKPGRRFILYAEVNKQTRKEPQPRVLILFSDTLWLCRMASTLGSGGLFDIRRSYRWPVEDVRTQIHDHFDFECLLEIRSRRKSAAVWFASKAKREEWAHKIEEARKERKELKQRITTAKRHESQRDKCIDVASRPTSFVESIGTTEGIETLTSDPGTPNGTIGNEMDYEDDDVEQPVWVNDRLSSKCLMERCTNEFSLFHRRHHCRNCGWLICRDCMGFAPVESLGFKREIVCPECFDSIMEKYNEGTLFPARMIKGEYLVEIIKKGKGKKEKIERVHPSDLFTAPFNKGLRKEQGVQDRLKGEQGVFSRVFLRDKKKETEMFGLLASKGLVLSFFRAAFDKTPVHHYVIYGYTLQETDLRDEGGNGVVFELSHSNQYGKPEDRHIITFRVANSSAEVWSTALRDAIHS